jgi:hypothetical protein
MVPTTPGVNQTISDPRDAPANGALTTRNAVVAPMQAPSIAVMCRNHQCILPVGFRSQ